MCNGSNDICGPSKNNLGIKPSTIQLEINSTSVAGVGDAMLLLLLMLLLPVAAPEAAAASEVAAMVG